VPLYVGLTLFIFVLLFSVAVLILCKKRASKPKEHPEETQCANVTETRRMYEEIREDQSRSPSVQTFAVYSVATASASRPLSKTEDEWSEVVYTFQQSSLLTQQRPLWSGRKRYLLCTSETN
ncbi:uncharacterized protein LOC121895206 isoform X2, partial [Scomber scombrus]